MNSHVTEINSEAARLTGATSDFFRPCSLRRSSSPCPELRFLRSVLLSYSLLAECGAKPVRFCVNQSQFKALLPVDPSGSLEILHALRTEAAHSIHGSSNTQTIEAITRSWFRQHTKSDFPTNDAAWATCAQAIDDLTNAIIEAIRKFLRLLEDDPEMSAMKNELRQSMDGGISRQEIEDLVAQTLANQGRSDISPGRITDRFITAWTTTLNLKSNRTILIAEARKLIDNEIANLPEEPPFTGRDIMDIFNLRGRIVGELIREQKRLFQSGTKDSSQLLEHLALHLKTIQSSDETRRSLE